MRKERIVQELEEGCTWGRGHLPPSEGLRVAGVLYRPGEQPGTRCGQGFLTTAWSVCTDEGSPKSGRSSRVFTPGSGIGHHVLEENAPVMTLLNVV